MVGSTVYLTFKSIQYTYLFLPIFISLLFLRPSKSYDIQAFLALGLGVFVGQILPICLFLTQNVFVKSFIQGIAGSYTLHLISIILFLAIGVQSLYKNSFVSQNILDNILIEPAGLFLLTVFLSLYNGMSYLSYLASVRIPFKILFLQTLSWDIIFWVTVGCMITMMKNIISELYLEKVFGIISTGIGLVMLSIFLLGNILISF